MVGAIRHFEKQIYPLLKECRSWITYHNAVLGGHGSILRRMKKTKSIYIHIPKTGGKSILKGIYGIDMHDGVGHATAGFYLSVFGQSKFRKYYKFAFVRNPWDRAFSAYNFAKKGGFGFQEDIKLKYELKDTSFESFVKLWLPKQDLKRADLIIFHPQYKFICDRNNALMVDQIFYFEDFANEYRKISSRFNITETAPYINRSNNQRLYQELYNKETREIIENIYYEDIQKFGYRFEEHIGFQ